MVARRQVSNDQTTLQSITENVYNYNFNMHNILNLDNI